MAKALHAVVRPFVAVFAFARARPWRALAVVLLLALGALGGADRWAAYHFRAAQGAYERDDYTEANRHLRLCLRVWRRSADAHLLGARLERKAQNFPEVERYLNALKRIEGETSHAAQLEWLLLRVETGEVDQLAPALMIRAEKPGPDSSAIHEAVARAFCHELRFPQAMAALSRWLEQEPDSARAHEWRGWVAQNTHQDDLARAEYARSLELQPDRVTARLRVINFFLDRNNPQEAEPHIDYLLQTKRRSTGLLLLQARCRLLQGRPEEAGGILDGVLARSPDNEVALLLRAEVEKGRRQPEKEEVYLRRVVALFPHKNTAALWALHQCLLAQRKEKEAAEWLRRYNELSAEIQDMQVLLTRDATNLPSDPDRCVKVAGTLLKLGHERGALNYLNMALRTNPRHVRAHLLLADYYEEKGRSEEAEAHRREAAQAPPPPAAKPKK